jgi:hypothetical protein
MRLFFVKNINLPFGNVIESLESISDSSDLTFIVTDSFLDTKYKQIVITDDIIDTQSKDIFAIKMSQSGNEIIDKICEIIRDFKTVHTFGDSHSIITHKIPVCRENWLGFNTNYPLTMHRLGVEGLHLHECVAKVGNGHEKYPIKPNDWAMYFYGEIDARYLILKQVDHLGVLETNRPGDPDKNWIDKVDKKNNVEDVINTLVNNFVKQVKINEENFGCKSLISSLTPPAKNPQVPNLYTGSLEQRLEVYEKFTKVLYEKCESEGIKVVNIYDKVVGEDKTIREEFLIKKDGEIHIDNEYYYIIRDEIMRNIITN